MHTYYYFCDACGADTAVYEIKSTCPYCSARTPKFHVVAEVSNPRTETDVLRQIQEFRQRWETKNGGREVGIEVKKRGFWRR